MPKESKPKAVNFAIIPPLDGEHMPEPYRLLLEVREMHHRDTRAAHIALAWRLRQKEDKDGHMVLGRCVKVSDLHREFSDYDFIIVLNQEVWDSPEFDKARKIALLDHELCHAAPDYDDDSGEHKRDERNRLLFRIRKHDIEEFDEVVQRHGCYKRDLERFARSIMNSQQPLRFMERDETTVSIFPVN